MASNRRRIGTGLAIACGCWLALNLGCAAAPRIPSASGQATSARLETPSPIYPTVEEAAIAGLVAAREHATPVSREAVRVGAVRRVTGGYVWMPPVVASASIRAGHPGVVRIRLERADVATFIVHPATGSDRIDRRNASLNASERRLLIDREGRERPLYLLTPRLEVVRHASDEPELLVADLREARRAGIEDTHRAGEPFAEAG